MEPAHPNTFTFREKCVDKSFFPQPDDDWYNTVTVEGVTDQYAKPPAAEAEAGAPPVVNVATTIEHVDPTQHVEVPPTELPGPTWGHTAPQGLNFTNMFAQNKHTRVRSGAASPPLKKKAKASIHVSPQIVRLPSGEWMNSLMYVDSYASFADSPMNESNPSYNPKKIANIMNANNGRFGTQYHQKLFGSNTTDAKNPAKSSKPHAPGLSTQQLLRDTTLVLSWANLCWESPQFGQKLHQAVSALIPNR